MPPDVIPVRAGEGLDLAALSAYLGSPVEVWQFPNGHSNLVYLVRVGTQAKTPAVQTVEYVLRRPPLGPVAPKAHDMGREFRVLRAVHPRFPEAPKAISFCEDPAVLGAPFFLMERRRGVVLRDVQPADPRRVSQAFVDCLIRLHAVDISVPEIGALGRPDGFVERQVRGWAERWRRAQTTDVPGMEGVIGWLAASIPPQQAPVLLHNDFKLDNVMLNEAGHGVATVLDWEMATLGDPLADLGLALCYWTNASTGHAITTAPGWYTREEFVERYAAATGRSMRNLGYHEVLGIFKLAVILQQIYFRFHRRQTSDERFRHFDLRVRELVELAVRRIDRV